MLSAQYMMLSKDSINVCLKKNETLYMKVLYKLKHYMTVIFLRCSKRENWLSSILWIHTHLSSVQLPSHVQLFSTPWTAALQASLSITNTWSLLTLMSIELVMPSNHLILYHPLLFLPSIFPSIRVFPMSQFFISSGQSIGSSASASVLPMNIQDWFPLGLTGLIFFQSRRLSRVFSSTTVQKHQFFTIQLS